MALYAGLRDDITFYVPTSDPVVALTLDDGPHPDLTPDVLGILGRHEAHATFFLIGSRAELYPNVVEQIVKAGHELGNHLWLNERADRLSNDEFEQKLVRTHRALSRNGPVSLLRPGQGLITKEQVRIAERHGYRCVVGSVYPWDPQIPIARWMSWRVRTGVHPGAIMILHEGKPSWKRVLTVLDEVLPNLTHRGYHVITASELIRHGEDDLAPPDEGGHAG